MRATGEACPSCEMGLEEGDVAIKREHRYLDCDDRVYVHGHGVHVVKDVGKIVEEQQLDH